MSNTTPRNCPRCGCSLENRTVDNLCAKCLGELNFATDTVIPGSVGIDSPPLFALEEVAALFPQLEVLEVLGRGGMGVVYKARQKALGRLVALKLLAPERVADPKFAERFAHEAQALAALSHPNIVTIHDFGQAGGVYYLLMEFVDGVNLRQGMTAGRFTPEQALAIVPPVCEALQYAHEHGIVHRDIKPENLLLDKEGRVKIADFGIAKMLGETLSGQDLAESQPAGTPQYMAPEQKDRRVADHRADIYSLGVVLYEMLTGELPADKLQPPSRRVQVDVRIDEIVLRALEVKPERRYQTAAELRTQVVTVARGTGDFPREPSAAAASARFPRTAIVGACLVVMGVLSLFLSFFVDQMATRPTTPDGMRSLHTPATAAPAMIGAALIYAFFATLLGWISVTQIRRSAGKLDGLWLAVFDGLFFPLLALDSLILAASGAIIWLLRQSSNVGVTPVWLMLFLSGLGLFTVVLIGWVDFFIVRAVWRAVNRMEADGVAERGAVSPHWKKIVLACIAIYLLIFWFFGVHSESVQWSGDVPQDAAGELLKGSAQGPSLSTLAISEPADETETPKPENAEVRPAHNAITPILWSGPQGTVLSIQEVKLKIGSTPASFGVRRGADEIRHLDLFVEYPTLLREIVLFGRLDVYPCNAATAKFLQGNAVPLDITKEDLRAAWDDEFVKVFYLPHPKPGNESPSPVEIVDSTDGDPQGDERAVEKARQSGEILVVLRLGKDFKTLGSFEGSAAFAQVQESLKKVRTAKYTVSISSESKTPLTWQVYLSESNVCRVEQPSGVYLVFDAAKKKLMEVNPAESKARVTEGLNVPDGFNVIAQLSRSELKISKESQSDEVKAIGAVAAKGFTVKDNQARFNIWVDPTNDLPLLVEKFSNGNDPGVTETWVDFQYDLPLQDSLFRFDAPEGFKTEIVHAPNGGDAQQTDLPQKPESTRRDGPSYGFGPGSKK